VNLEEALKVQVRYLILVLGAKKLAQLCIGQNATTELGVKAVVLLDVARHILGHIRLRALALCGETHERAHLIGQKTRLQESIVLATSLPDKAILGRKRLGIHLTTTLGITKFTLDGLGNLLEIVSYTRQPGSQVLLERLESLLKRR